jgi:predicted tellurium resistance membrane protein TerC
MPGLASAAYQLVLWIGIKLLASGVDQAFHLATADRSTGWRSHLPKSVLDMHFEISETLFWTVMASIIVVAVLRSLSKKSRLDPEFVETMRDLSKMDQSIDETANDAVDSIGDAMKPEG